MSTTTPPQPTVGQDHEWLASMIYKSMQSQLVSTAGASDAILPNDSRVDSISSGDSTEFSLTRETWQRLFGETVSVNDEPRTNIWMMPHRSHAPNVDATMYYTGSPWSGWSPEPEPVAPTSAIYSALQPAELTTGASSVHIPFLIGSYANYASRVLELADLPQESLALRHVNVQPLVWLRVMRNSARAARARFLSSLGKELDRSKSGHAARSPRDIVTELSDDYGLNQLSTARAVGVTPTAVRKWRRGEQARPEYQDRLAQLTALLGLLRDTGKDYPAAWLEVPVSSESTLTPLDLFAAGRPELVLSLASDPDDVRTALHDFDQAWRRNYAPDRDYMVAIDSNGERAVVPREDPDT